MDVRLFVRAKMISAFILFWLCCICDTKSCFKYQRVKWNCKTPFDPNDDVAYFCPKDWDIFINPKGPYMTHITPGVITK